MLLNFIALAAPIVSIVTTIAFAHSLTAPQRLLYSIAPLLFSLKLNILLRLELAERSQYSKIGLLLYLFAWPGMNPKPFKQVSQNRNYSRLRALGGTVIFAFGLAIIHFMAKNFYGLGGSISTWGMIAGLLITIHFGFSELLTQCMLRLGWRVTPLFKDPLLSISLRDFWSHRWNLAFVEMNKLIFLPLFRKVSSDRLSIFLIFLVSALLHEYAISFPAGGGWGGPSAYFLLHGTLVMTEETYFKLSSWNQVARRVWTIGWVLIPVPILFHSYFRSNLVLPLITFLNEVLC